jgi:hypothetical protein
MSSILKLKYNLYSNLIFSIQKYIKIYLLSLRSKHFPHSISEIESFLSKSHSSKNGCIQFSSDFIDDIKDLNSSLLIEL